jgi:hypothetical protein
MALIAHRYVTLSKVKARLGITDTASDTLLLSVIDGVSRDIDEYCRRWFFPVDQVRYFETDDPNELEVPHLDILAVSQIDLDYDDDGVYETTWMANSGNFYLEPVDAQQQIPAKPYWSIEIYKRVNAYFPIDLEKSIKVTGTFGYFDQRTVTTTVHTAFNSAATSIALHNANTTLEVNQHIRIDSEQLFITAINGVNVTVTRGVNGTTAASHSVDASVETYDYPVIGDACGAQCVLSFRQQQHPYGTVGVGDVLTEPRVMVAGGLHPFVRSMIMSYRRLNYGSV